MDQDVEKHRIIRDSLEMELQGLRKRLARVESFAENQDIASVNGRYSEDHLPRSALAFSSLPLNFSFSYFCF